MGLTRTVAPATTPILLTEAKLFARIPDEIKDEDVQIQSWIASGVHRCEDVTGLSLMTQTWELSMDSFFDCAAGCRCVDGIGPVIPLYHGPVQAVTSIVYVATDGTSTTLAGTEYQVDVKTRPGPARIAPAYGKAWPVPRVQMGAVVITYTTGFGASAAAVPDEIKDALKNYVAYRYQHREDADEDVMDRIFRRFWDGGY